MKEFILPLVTKDGFLLQMASAPLRENREVVLAACNQKGRALRFASEALRANRDIVLVVAAQNRKTALEYPQHPRAHALPHASPELQEKFSGDRLVAYVTEQLTAHSSFVRLVLCAMTHAPPTADTAAAEDDDDEQQPSTSKKSRGGGGGGGDASTSGCLLPMLHIDEEGAGLHIKKTIADYAGVPHGASMAAVRCAAGHLELPKKKKKTNKKNKKIKNKQEQK